MAEVRKATYRSLLRGVEENSASLVILDPPALGITGDGDFDTLCVDMVHLAEEIEPILKPGGATVFIGAPLITAAWELACQWSGFQLSAEITVLWLGIDNSSRSTSVRWHTNPGKRFGIPPSISLPSNVVVCNEVSMKDRWSPTQKPVELFNYLISILSKGLVVDPFCGTGSSLVAAEMCGREWIGGDIDQKQVDIANRRLRLIDLEEGYLRPLYLWVNGKLQEIGG